MVVGWDVVVRLEMTVSTERDREDAGVRWAMTECSAMRLVLSRVDEGVCLPAFE